MVEKEWAEKDQEDKLSKIPSHGCVSLEAAILITESGATKRFY